MSGNKALRRALGTNDAIRLGTKLPLITDTTEMITPEIAQEMLQRNKNNRPINWNKVDEWVAIMQAGQWQLTPQGLILDTEGNILTGQHRLWAVVRSGVTVYMRVSRGNSPEIARILDRGIPQSARDLATRETERKHSPTESSVARAIAIIRGIKPTTDTLADILIEKEPVIAQLMRDLKGTAKSRAVLMLMAAVAEKSKKASDVTPLALRVPRCADMLTDALRPVPPEKIWGKGAAFALAMSHAVRIIG
jgi:hypothetical protein